MQRRPFGKTPIEISAISLGCWIFGVDRWGHYTEERAFELLNFSRELGITYFDNGDAYGNGRAETIFGKWLKQFNIPRDQVEIGGKVGYDFYSDPGEPGGHQERKQDFSPKFVRFSLEQALKRLGVETIDVYMAHNIKLPQFRDDLWEVLDEVKKEGKIRTWGVSLGPAIGWREEGIKAMLDHGAKAVQTVYNMFEQHPGHEFCETAVATGGGVLARVHDNSGILKDVVEIDTPIAENDQRKFRDQVWKINGLKKLELVRHYAADHGMTVHQLACKWLLQQRGLTAITGTLLNEHEIREAAESVDKPNLSMKELIQIAEDYARDWDLGPDAHPCDIKSSIDPSGRVRSGYVPSPVMIA
jgi:aryl-alcohol dehydrogenase-like predicted oxidoreductase